MERKPCAGIDLFFFSASTEGFKPFSMKVGVNAQMVATARVGATSTTNVSDLIDDLHVTSQGIGEEAATKILEWAKPGLKAYMHFHARVAEMGLAMFGSRLLKKMVFEGTAKQGVGFGAGAAVLEKDDNGSPGLDFSASAGSGIELSMQIGCKTGDKSLSDNVSDLMDNLHVTSEGIGQEAAATILGCAKPGLKAYAQSHVKVVDTGLAWLRWLKKMDAEGTAYQRSGLGAGAAILKIDDDGYQYPLDFALSAVASSGTQLSMEIGYKTGDKSLRCKISAPSLEGIVTMFFRDEELAKLESAW